MPSSGGVAAEFEAFRSSCSVYLDLFHGCSCKKALLLLPVGRADLNCPVRGAAVKGRLRDYYRYGRVRSCTSYWNDFWFCIRLKYVTDTEGLVSCRLIAGRVGYGEDELWIGNVSAPDEFRRQNQFSHQGASHQWAPLSHAL